MFKRRRFSVTRRRFSRRSRRYSGYRRSAGAVVVRRGLIGRERKYSPFIFNIPAFTTLIASFVDTNLKMMHFHLRPFLSLNVATATDRGSALACATGTGVSQRTGRQIYVSRIVGRVALVPYWNDANRLHQLGIQSQTYNQWFTELQHPVYMNTVVVWDQSGSTTLSNNASLAKTLLDRLYLSPSSMAFSTGENPATTSYNHLNLDVEFSNLRRNPEWVNTYKILRHVRTRVGITRATEITPPYTASGAGNRALIAGMRLIGNEHTYNVPIKRVLTWPSSDTAGEATSLLNSFHVLSYLTLSGDCTSAPTSLGWVVQSNGFIDFYDS